MIGRPTWMIVETLTGVPTSCAMSRLISVMRAPRASAIRDAYLARSVGGVRDHCSNAPRAARTARSASSAVPLGMLPMTSSVVESRTAIVSVHVGTVQVPPM